MGSHQLPEVDVNRHRQGSGARRHFEHLPGADPPELARIICERKPRIAFQRDQPAEAVRAGFEDHCRSGDGDRDHVILDGAAAGILRHPQQDRAALDVCRASRLAETEDRIGAETRDGQVGEGQFGARFVAGPHPGILGHFVLYHRVPGVRLRGKELYLADDLRHLRFLWSLGECGRGRERCRDDEARATDDPENEFHRGVW